MKTREEMRFASGKEDEWAMAEVLDAYPSWWKSEQPNKGKDIIAWKPA